MDPSIEALDLGYDALAPLEAVGLP